MRALVKEAIGFALDRGGALANPLSQFRHVQHGDLAADTFRNLARNS